MEQAGTYPLETSLSVTVEGKTAEIGAGHIMVPIMSATDADDAGSFTLGGVRRPLADFLRGAADRLEQEDDEGEAE